MQREKVQNKRSVVRRDSQVRYFFCFHSCDLNSHYLRLASLSSAGTNIMRPFKTESCGKLPFRFDAHA